MGLFRTEALVLRTVDFSESTQIAHFYSPDRGKFSAIAKGVKRFKSRLGPRLEAFAQVQASVYAKEGAALGTLSSLELLRDWPYLRADLGRHALAALVFESIDRGTEEGKPGPDLYRLAVCFLEELGAAGDPQSLAAHALLRVLCLLGFAPDLREPEERGGPGAARGALFFLPDQGRLSTASPADPRLPRLALDGPSRAFLRQSMGLRAEEFAAFAAPPGLGRPLLAFLIRLFQFYVETDLKSARFLRRMIWEKSQG